MLNERVLHSGQIQHCHRNPHCFMCHMAIPLRAWPDAISQNGTKICSCIMLCAVAHIVSAARRMSCESLENVWKIIVWTSLVGCLQMLESPSKLLVQALRLVDGQQQVSDLPTNGNTHQIGVGGTSSLPGNLPEGSLALIVLLATWLFRVLIFTNGCRQHTFSAPAIGLAIHFAYRSRTRDDGRSQRVLVGHNLES